MHSDIQLLHVYLMYTLSSYVQPLTSPHFRPFSHDQADGGMGMGIYGMLQGHDGYLMGQSDDALRDYNPHAGGGIASGECGVGFRRPTRQ